jgi:hypothetical protein
MQIKTKIRKNYDRIEPRFDTMKYWKVIRNWAKQKYKISISDMDMLFFLYSEGLFTKDCFDEFMRTMLFDKDKFEKFRTRGFIIKWRNEGYRQKAMYELSYSAKRLVYSIYAKLNGEDEIPTNKQQNPMDLAGSTKATKRYYALINKFNAEVRERKKEQWRRDQVKKLKDGTE